MKYITVKRFKRDGLTGHFNIPYGKPLERKGEVLFFEDRAVCLARSAAAHEHFALDDDGKGKERGELSRAIMERLSPDNFETKEERNEFWERTVWKDKLTQKYRRSEHTTTWLWSDDFFNAPIEDLKYIAALVGAKGKEGRKCLDL